MSKQDDFLKVNKAFIEPLARLYGKTLNDEMIDAFVDDLRGFSHETLEKAAGDVRRSNKFFPTIAAAIEACMHHREHRSAPTTEIGRRAIYQSARNEAIGYANKFMGSALGQQSRVEGWDVSLRKFVIAAAWIQAQFIHGLAAGGEWGYDTVSLGCDGNSTLNDRLLAENVEQGKRGVIEVGVPSELIAGWQEMAQWRAKRVDRNPPLASRISPRSSVDDYLDSLPTASLRAVPPLEASPA